VSALVLATVLLMGPVVGFDFIAEYDDAAYILEHSVLKNPSVAGLASLFTTRHNEDYLPLLHLSFFLDALWAGGRPLAYHLTNLAMHIANGLLVFFLASRLLKDLRTAFFLALIFLTHPVQVESVAWIPERKNVLSTFLLLLASWKILVRDRAWSGFFFYFLALFAKSIAVVYPLFLAVHGFLFERRVGRPVLGAMFGAAVLVSILTVLTQSQVGAVKDGFHGGSSLKTAILMGQAYWGYLYSLLTGRGLSPLHAFSEIHYGAGITFYFVTGASFWLLYRYRLKGPLCMFACFFIFLLPVSNIIPIAVLQADRYLYVPVLFFFAGVFLLFDILWKKAMPERSTLGVSLLGVLFFVSLAPATAGYLPVYGNAHLMWSEVAQDPSVRATAYYNLGVVEEKQHRLPTAMAYYEAARRAGGHCRATNNLGALFFDAGQYDKAHPLFVEAAGKCPQHPEILYNLALSHLKGNDPQSARRLLKEVAGGAHRRTDLAELARKALAQMAPHVP